MSLRVLLLLLVVLVMTLLAGLLIRVVRRRRPQFGLRSLLVGCALVSVILSAFLSWDYWTKAQTTWLAPSSPEAASLVSEPLIVEDGRGYRATFRPRFRSLGELLSIMEKAKLPTGTSMGFRSDYHSLEATFEAAQREPLQARLSLLKTHDVLQPGWSVIRGRIEDSLGRPIQKATVDLMGSYVYINYFQTRDDGTFLMPIQAPSGDGYYLRIRYDGDTRRMNTRRFTLDPANQEMAVLIRVR